MRSYVVRRENHHFSISPIANAILPLAVHARFLMRVTFPVFSYSCFNLLIGLQGPDHRHHIGQRRQHFFPAACFQASVGS
jgi:hypothetical protein